MSEANGQFSVTVPGTETSLAERYQRVRAVTEKLCEPLETEDYVLQSMPDTSPTRWHLAHTTWFFEQFVLNAVAPDYDRFDPQFGYLFNSYYVQVGERHGRSERGMLSRPTVAEVYAYRRHVDAWMNKVLERSGDAGEPWAAVVELGLQHEQQHQELLLTDIKHAFGMNPVGPIYRERGEDTATAEPELSWIEFDEGLAWIGHDGDGFAFDNESPRHRVFLESFRLGSRPVTNAEFQKFIDDGGYRRPELWLFEGWAAVEREGWNAPLYWHWRDGQWWTMTLAGLRPVVGTEPVCHVSYFEADAYARWAGARLPTEAEWERASQEVPLVGHFVDDERFHPAACSEQVGLGQMFGDVWEWTSSAHAGYPGYRPADGALGEYNGKFMCNQLVLRGGSCVTPADHIRRTYRNFFHPPARWQFAGFRLARDR